MSVRRDAHTHPHPEAGGLILCGECATGIPGLRPYTHAELVPLWSDTISETSPRYCDQCCAPVVAADTPVEERDPFEVYGTLEHEWLLIEEERGR